MKLRIATRSSRLALWQANFIADALRNLSESPEVELVEVTTTGDQDRTQPLHEMGGVGVFTREVQRAVLDGRADLAVHSLKDLPTETVAGLTLAAVPARASQFDALVLPTSTGSMSLADLPAQSRIGTGSLRRKAQLLHARGDLEILPIRGNVETRLSKLDAGEFDAVILAEAGLQRLDLGERISHRLAPPDVYPAVGQGALGIECRADDDATCALLSAIDDIATRSCVTAERALLADLEAGCHAPVGAMTTVEDGQITLDAVVLSTDGRQRLQANSTASVEDPSALGIRVAEALRQQGADELL